jgi:hypothetical protein
MTSKVDLPLSELAQRLAKKQSELQHARQAYDARLANLSKQKAALESQLRDVEKEIQAVGKATPAAAPKSAPKSAPTAKRAAVAPRPRGASGQTLPGLLVELVRAAGGPVTVKELTQQVVRSKFQTTSTNIPRMVNNKVGELVKRGLLRRATGRPGVVLGQAPAAKAKAAAKPAANSKKSAKPAPAAKPAAKPAAAAADHAKGSLRALLVQLLAQSNRPLRAKELADLALQKGYKTTSGTFVNVVWDALNKLSDVENVRGKGYQLKKSARTK